MFRATRQLLAAAKATSGKSAFQKAWLSDTATYPVLAIMAGACGLVVYQGQRLTLNHPDIVFNKNDRTHIRDNDDDAFTHHEHALRKYARQGNTQITPGLNAMMVQGKVKA